MSTIRRKITATAAATGVAAAMLLGGAAPASAATHTGSYHKSPSILCILKIKCNYITHCYKSPPNTAATKVWVNNRICYGAHVDAY